MSGRNKTNLNIMVNQKNSKSMVVDGIFASEAIDSSGEVILLKGMDVSSLSNEGAVNYEHADSTHNGQEIVGRVIYTKKIFGPEDCENERELKYYNMVGLPILYGIARLADSAGHPGAVALAALIREHNAHNEPIMVRYSIEGQSIDRDPNDKNVITKSIARRVALTLTPCNKTAKLGLVLDPNAPKGFEPAPDINHISGFEKKEKSFDPRYLKVTEFSGVYNPEFGELEKSDSEVDDLQKALAAGSDISGTPDTRVQFLQKVLGVLEKKRDDLMKRRVGVALEKWDGEGNVDDFLMSELKDLSPDKIKDLMQEVRQENTKKASELIWKMEYLAVEYSQLTKTEE